MQRWIARLKKTDPSRGHETIHKNIKSSLREIIKGGDPQSTSNTILSCALEASAHLQPRRSSLLPPCATFIPPLPSLLSSQSLFALVHQFAAVPFHSARVRRRVVCCRAGDAQLPQGDPPASGDVQKEEKKGGKNKLRRSFGTEPWLTEVTANRKQQQQPTTQ